MKRIPGLFRCLASAFVLAALLFPATSHGLEVTLTAAPSPASFPFDGAPKVGGPSVTLTATLAQDLVPGIALYKFTAVLLPSHGGFPFPPGREFVIQGSSPSNEATWTPTKGGDYRLRVYVKKGSATASAAVAPYHVKPSITSQIQLSASPPVMALPGAFTISATAPPIPASGHPPPPLTPTKHRVWFRHQEQFVAQPPGGAPWAPPITSTGAAPAVWTPNPPLTPGAYAIEVYVQSFQDDVLRAEGRAWSYPFQADFYRGAYIVLLPPGPCPSPTVPADPTQPFGWLNPITTQNSFNLPVGTPQAGASCPIAGYSINDIANNPQLRVRTINVACTNCHISLMAGTQGRDWFCIVLPFGFPHVGQFGEATSETTLFKLFTNWWSRGCPD